MLLSDSEILNAIEESSIVIKPFNIENLGPNSYDLHLGNFLATFKDDLLDVKKDNEVEYFQIPETGFILQPGKLYLGVTKEYTETHKFVPCLENKSSLARLGISIHMAPLGNVHFCNHWTLEISCIHPIRIYKDMPIAQILYFKINHETILKKYNKNPLAKYNIISDKPTKSMMWKNFL